MGKKLIVDIYSEIDEEDQEEELIIDAGDVRCTESGELYTGTFIIKDLKVVKQDDLNNEKSL